MIDKKLFGKTKKGNDVTLYTIINKNKMKVSFIDYGANIVSIVVPDKKGNFSDIVLGYDNIEGYENDKIGLGSFIGRHANRIGGAEFKLNGKVIKLEKNDGNNNLHSGFKRYNNLMYKVETDESEDLQCIKFSRLSPHMEQGFPGNLEIKVIYTLTNNNELIIKYYAVSDKDTLVNFTNHSYFNLSGHNSGSVLEQKVWINADKFTPTTDDLIPTGEILDVKGTPMDFKVLKALGQDIEANYKPLKQAGGYDHNFVLNISGDKVEKVAELVDEKTGRIMEVFTDLPGLQLYSANFFEKENFNYKDKANYKKRDAICFETQYFPNSCNIDNFKSCELKAKEEYKTTTIYKFSVK